jgi:GNAT superfamily N-acetyltransferase
MSLAVASELDFGVGYWPGAIGEITRLHATYYAQNWHFGAFFEAQVACDVAEFVGRYADNTDALITASRITASRLGSPGGSQELAGSIAIDGHAAHAQGAHLRWFIVSSTLRTRGLGKELLNRAMRFCREQAYPKVYLWTFSGLDAARGLYERQRFELTSEVPGERWGRTVTGQRFEWYAQI